MQYRRFAFALALLASQAARADLTIRYGFEVTFGPAFPAAIADAARQQIAMALPGAVATQVKGNKCSSSFGSLRSIMDTGTGEISLLDPATKRFSMVPLATYATFADGFLAQQQVPAETLVALQTALQNLKLDVQTKKTGDVSTIQGIQTEDNLIVLTISLATPSSAPIGLRMEVHQWQATAAEMARIPELGEISRCSAAPGTSSDPSVIIQKFLDKIPAAMEKFGDAMKEIMKAKGTPTLKTQVEIFAPGILAMMQAQGAAALPANLDVNAPLIKVAFNLAELSTSPLPDGGFEVPEGYQRAPLEDLFKDLIKAVPVPVQEPKTPAHVVMTAPNRKVERSPDRPRLVDGKAQFAESGWAVPQPSGSVVALY